VLNQPRYRRLHPAGAQELRLRLQPRARPWALEQYGFRAILAPSFADIFFNNCFKNGLLPIVLPESVIGQLFDEVRPSRLPADHRSGAPGRRQARRRRDRLRRAALPQVLPAQRLDDIGLTLRHPTRSRPSKPAAWPASPGWRTRSAIFAKQDCSPHTKPKQLPYP
jgi:3-isopropylmalate/(R)-2-methylmalate dehydratase small subunit